jgi:sporulation protein YlmC with PRC-barrel domain
MRLERHTLHFANNREGRFTSMKTQILLAVSMIALTAANPAFADTQTAENPAAQQKTSGSLKKDVEHAWEDIKSDTAHAFENIEATFIGGDEKAEIKPVTIDSRITASGMIGQPVMNSNQERVGTFKDVILDKDGKAVMAIVADGEFPGIDAKLVAFDYNIIARQNKNGDVIMPLTESAIDNAAEFSYDAKGRNENVRVMPANGYSVSKLLDADLLDQKKETVAQVDNISFKNGYADQIIIVFDQILGLGGEKAVLDYRDAQLTRTGDKLNFQLSANQAKQFEIYKKTTTN